MICRYAAVACRSLGEALGERRFGKYKKVRIMLHLWTRIRFLKKVLTNLPKIRVGILKTIIFKERIILVNQISPWSFS
jgi:hypothetical protein